MRTLQIGDGWPDETLSGLNRYFSELMRYLPATGTEVQGLVVGAKNILDRTRGVIVPFAQSGDYLGKRLYKSRRTAQRLYRQNKPDLVASHFALYAVPLTSELRKMPLVVHFHGPWAAESEVEGSSRQRSSFKFAIERLVYSRAQRLIVLSKAFQRELALTYKLDEERLRVIPGGIDTDRFNVSISRKDARRKLSWPQDRPIILVVRRHVRRMGLENLIDAMKELTASCPEVLLFLGGKGPITGELRTRIGEYGLDRNVKLLGRIHEDDLPLSYRAADLTVVPSQSLEGFGLVTLESLACGTPVIVTPIGGLPEVIQSFAPECIFSDASARSIADLLIEALQGRRKMPTEQSCRAHAVNNFSWPRIAGKVREVYDEAMSESA